MQLARRLQPRGSIRPLDWGTRPQDLSTAPRGLPAGRRPAPAFEVGASALVSPLPFRVQRAGRCTKLALAIPSTRAVALEIPCVGMSP